ncbi:hypothetical protein JCM14469_34230 [Desulfatiferula olefinivorans]
MFAGAAAGTMDASNSTSGKTHFENNRSDDKSKPISPAWAENEVAPIMQAVIKTEIDDKTADLFILFSLPLR